MTDVSMDVDALHQPSLEVPADDDLINYESDAADYSLLPEQDDIVEAIPEAVEKTYPETELAEPSGDARNEEQTHAEPTEFSVDAVDATVTAPEEQAEPEQATEAEIPFDAEAADAALDALTENVGDEIDYSLGEVDYQGEQNEEAAEADAVEDVTDAADAAENVAPEAHEEKAEISWEDDEAAVPVVEENQPHNPFQTNAIVFDLDQSNGLEDDENESRDYRQDELQALEEAITGDDSMDVNAELSVDASDTHFPSITVQYQGDEFPFLASGSEGFFSDASILDGSMQSIFSGFRSQLGNEIRPDDELVFQVDELGLEFTESNTAHDLTMNQILEIFDLLVKNDDPDGTRTLYTYLFTRLNTSKRYEYLVESATSGKGLDEVQHLFPQRSSHQESDAENEDESASSDEHAEGQEESEDHDQDDAEQVEEYAEEHTSYDENVDNAEEYHEESVENQEDAEYFDEAAGAIDDAHQDDSASIDQAEGAEPTGHDDSFAHEHSSTTSTLQGDADGTALDADADDDTAVDAEADGPVFVTEANEDAEIDWRDDDENDVVGDGGSVTGKRSRDDEEEPDVEDEIGEQIPRLHPKAKANHLPDFKRRRP